MIVENRKTKEDYSLTSQEWDKLKELGLQKLYKVIDSGMKPEKKVLTVQEIITKPAKPVIKKVK
jgi:hypothetical protein